MKTTKYCHYRAPVHAIAGLMLTLLVAGCSDRSKTEMAETARPAYVVSVGKSALGNAEFIGEVRSTRRAEMAFPVAGRVVSVNAEIGDTVLAGQVLAMLDQQPFKANLQAALGELARAEAHASEAKKRLERLREADKLGATSGGELTAAHSEVAAADAAVRIAGSSRDAAAWSLDQSNLRAPSTGVVATRVLEVGQAVAPGQSLMSIDGDGRELTVLLPATVSVHAGQAVVLKGNDGQLASKVLRVASRLDAGGVRRVFLSVPPTALVGSTWSAVLANAKEKEGIRIPLRALLPSETSGSGKVLVLASSSTVEQVPVKFGRVDGEYVEITDGLKPGHQVVVAGAAGIRLGTKVVPVPYQPGVKS
jgi:membrane fusion protein, multidrug efflux system